MSSKHATAPWFGASEQTQASLMLAAIQEDIDVPSSQQPPAPEFHLPTQEEISTVPLNPSTEEVAPEESLPYTQDLEEELSPEQEQELLAATEEEERAAPSDSRTWEYGRNVQGTMWVWYLKCDDPSKELTTVSTQQDVPAESGDASDVPPAKKSKRDDGATSMWCGDVPTSYRPIDVPMTWLTGQFVDRFRVMSLFYGSLVHFF